MAWRKDVSCVSRDAPGSEVPALEVLLPLGEQQQKLCSTVIETHV